MLATRLLTVALVAPVFLAALFLLSNFVWACFLLLWVTVAAREWGGLAKWSARGSWLYAGLLFLSGGAFLLVPALGRYAPADMGIWVLAAAFWLVIVPALLYAGKHRNPDVLFAVMGWIVLFPLWLAMVRLQEQPMVLLVLLGVVWIADSAAYFAGRLFGRHKLAPAISPGKTWEGVAGAFLTVVAYYALLVAMMPAADLLHGNVLTGLALFFLMTALSIEGDLFESMLKRAAGVKDSGKLLPGHGGVLDRIDGLTSSLPLAALVIHLHN